MRSPQYIRNIALVEGVQRRTMKIIQGMEQLLHEARLKELGLFSLEMRKLQGELRKAFQ